MQTAFWKVVSNFYSKCLMYIYYYPLVCLMSTISCFSLLSIFTSSSHRFLLSFSLSAILSHVQHVPSIVSRVLPWTLQKYQKEITSPFEVTTKREKIRKSDLQKKGKRSVKAIYKVNYTTERVFVGQTCENDIPNFLFTFKNLRKCDRVY